MMKIAFYKGRTRFFDRAIQFWTRSPYSHCELVFSVEIRPGADLCASSSFPDGGVRTKVINLDPARWDIIDIPWASEEVATEWVMNHSFEKYDLMGLLGFVLPFRNNPKRWFCSEACAAALGVDTPWRFSPATLHAAIMKFGTRG